MENNSVQQSSQVDGYTSWYNSFPLMHLSDQHYLVTVDRERFAGPNVRVFNPIKVFAEIFSHCLGQQCLLFSMIKERHLYSRENFCGTLENHEKREYLAYRIFPRLRYSVDSIVIELLVNCRVISKNKYRKLSVTQSSSPIRQMDTPPSTTVSH